MFAWCDAHSNTLFPVVFAVGNVPHEPPPPQQVYRVTYQSHATPSTIAAGQRTTVALRLRNDGNVLWAAGGQHPVRISYHWLPAGTEGVRTPLPRNIGPGETATIDAALQAPPGPGAYTLRWDLLEEGTGWFAARGATPLDVPVRVQSADAPVRRWTASASHNSDDAIMAIDSDPQTIWSSGQTQQPGMWFTIDLGAVQAVSSTSMISPEKDFPRGYVLEVSVDGSVWTEVARKDPNWRSVDVAFEPVRARYVRLTLTRVPKWPVPWSISDTAIMTTPLWTATASPNPADARLAVDGNLQTRWTTGAPQRPGAWFQVDFGEKLFIERLRLDNTSNPQYPRGYVIKTSLDGLVWEEVARRASNWATVDVRIGPRWARYLRIENTGSSPWHPWSIAELSIVTATPSP
jgi:hypothetical protein